MSARDTTDPGGSAPRDAAIESLAATDDRIVLPDMIDGEHIRVSASSYVTFLQCPDSAMARYRGEYGPESRASFRGGLAHRLFARHLNDGPIASADFEQVCREEIGSSTLNHKLASLKLKPSELARVIAEAQALYERFTSFPSDGFDGAEIFIEHDAGGDVEIIGSIDARFNDADGVRLVDWKTGDLGDPMPQLRFYALLWALEKGSLPAVVEAVSIKTGERLMEQPTVDVALETAEGVRRLVNAIRQGWKSQTQLARHGGPACRFCPLLESCDEGRSAAAVLAISTR